jgi:hypothetical protein
MIYQKPGTAGLSFYNVSAIFRKNSLNFFLARKVSSILNTNDANGNLYHDN